MSSPEDNVFYTCDELTPDLCDLHIEEGHVLIMGISVSYWIYTSNENNDDPSLDDDKLPIIVLHGGPSFTHNYMLPLKQQACRGRSVIFYDQAGCGKSPGPKDVPSHLLDPYYYATVELPTLVEHLGFANSSSSSGGGFHLLGNSWGTMLAQMYALDRMDRQNDQNMASMVLSGPFSDSQTYIQAQWDPVDGSIGSLPTFLQQRIRFYDESRDFNSSEYQAINAALSSKFTLRTFPPPDCWMDSLDQANTAIYSGMQGPSEFSMSGTLARVNLTGRLAELQTTPVLLTHGKYDTMRPVIVRTMQQALKSPTVERLYFTKSGHVSMIDQPKEMNDGIADFFDRVEANRTAAASIMSREGDDARRGFTTTTATTTTTTTANQWMSVTGMLQERSQHAVGVDEEIPATTMAVGNNISMILSVVLALGIGYVLGSIHARHRMQRKYDPISN